MLALLLKWKFESVRLMFQHLAHFLRALSKLFLKLAEQLVVFTFSVGKVVVAQLSVLLLELALDFIPGAFELELVHVNYSPLSAQLAVLEEVLQLCIHRVVGWQDRPPGIFGLCPIQVAAI